MWQRYGSTDTAEASVGEGHAEIPVEPFKSVTVGTRKGMATSKTWVSADGNTMMFEFSDSGAANADPVTGKGSETRVAKGPAGKTMKIAVNDKLHGATSEICPPEIPRRRFYPQIVHDRRVDVVWHGDGRRANRSSGTIQCGKPDPQHVALVGDRPDHRLGVEQVKCTSRAKTV